DRVPRRVVEGSGGRRGDVHLDELPRVVDRDVGAIGRWRRGRAPVRAAARAAGGTGARAAGRASRTAGPTPCRAPRCSAGPAAARRRPAGASSRSAARGRTGATARPGSPVVATRGEPAEGEDQETGSPSLRVDHSLRTIAPALPDARKMTVSTAGRCG